MPRHAGTIEGTTSASPTQRNRRDFSILAMASEPSARKALERLAALHGIQTSYVDMAKRRREARVHSILAILRALGAPVERLSDCPEALRSTLQARAKHVVEPVIVSWEGRRTAVEVSLPQDLSNGSARLELQLEGGEARQRSMALKRAPTVGSVKLDGIRYVRKRIRLPWRVPFGRHGVCLESGGGQWQSTLLAAPGRFFGSAHPVKQWGVFAPLYALHSDRSWGAGDYGDLRGFIAWISDQGGNVATTLPLLPAFLERPFDPSPYSPVSRLFWNEFYLDINQVPELETCAQAGKLVKSKGFQMELSRLKADPLVRYRELMALKRRVLEIASRHFLAGDSRRKTQFERYVRSHPWVEDYAAFRAVHERQRKPWTEWPQRLRRGELREGDSDRATRQYHLYAQWLAHEQMAAVEAGAEERGVKLYLDMPLGVRGDGYDTWRFRESFAQGVSGGAPPDPVFTKGQDWGFAPLHPQGIRRAGYEYVTAFLRHHLSRARMLRFDHVMSLHRLYWIPSGFPATEGVYVHYPAEELYALLSLESHRHRALIVGENLGTVPPEVNRSIAKHGMREMYVVQYELKPNARRPLRAPRRLSVAGLNTHDMPPFRAYCRKADIADRFALGLLRRREVEYELNQRERILKALVLSLVRSGRLSSRRVDTREVLRAVFELLSAGDAETVLVNLEDLWLETRSQNVPGTSTERVNWRRKARFSLKKLRELDSLTRLLRQVNLLRRGTGHVRGYGKRS